MSNEGDLELKEIDGICKLMLLVNLRAAWSLSVECYFRCIQPVCEMFNLKNWGGFSDHLFMVMHMLTVVSI